MISNLLEKVGVARLVFLVVFIIITNTLEVLGIALFIPIIDLVQNAGASSSSLSTAIFAILNKAGLASDLQIFLWLLFAVFVAKAILSLWLRSKMVDLASQVQHNIRSRLFNSLLEASVNYINKSRQGEILNTINEHTIRVSVAFFLFVQLIAAWISVLAYICFIAKISWQLTLFSLVLGSSFAPIVIRIGYKAKIAGRGYIKASESLHHHSAEALYSKKIINAMNWANIVEQRFARESEALRDCWMKMAFWSNSSGILMQPLAVAILSLIVLFSLHFNLSSSLLGAFVLSFIRLIPNLQAAVIMGVEFQANKSSVQRVYDILAQSDAAKERSGELYFQELCSGVRLDSVRFSYDEMKQVLDDVTLKIPKGKTVALVGPSGSGKTTIVELILGLYQPNSGKVLLDGVPLSSIDLKSFRQRVAYVSQDAMLFNDTIRANLVMGLNREITDEELKSACTSAGAWGFILKRSKGLDALIGDRGSALSGGQRQRLALARSLLRRPALLILDEATSALDHDGEQWIQKTLQTLQISGLVTIILIAHRYSTIEHADLIYEVRDGKVECLGNWVQARAHLSTNDSKLGLIN